ncbi:MAG: diaminopimelate decarboxylase [Fervidicoccaceae archaeon]
MGIAYINGILSIGGISAEEIAKEFGTPIYVYDEETIRKSYERIREAFSYENLEIMYAAKANSNIHILKIMRELGAGLDAVSPYEVLLGRMAGFAPESILFTGSSVSNEDMRMAIEAGALINIDSISQLRRYASLFPGGEVSIRINLGYGSGYHSYLVTGGRTKFGIDAIDLDLAIDIAMRNGIKIIGLHTHMGSGIVDWKLYVRALKDLLTLARKLDGLEFVDVGGGFGIAYRKEDPSIEIEKVGAELSRMMHSFNMEIGRSVKLRIEPGRFLVARAGALIARVVDVKEIRHGEEREAFIGIDSGMGHLIRPALYEAYHEVVPVREKVRERIRAHVVGNYCESGDIIALDRILPYMREGDLLAVLDAGAYGYSMSSNYNMRPRPAEVMVRIGGKVELIRRRETFEDMVRGMIIK